MPRHAAYAKHTSPSTKSYAVVLLAFFVIGFSAVMAENFSAISATGFATAGCTVSVSNSPSINACWRVEGGGASEYRCGSASVAMPAGTNYVYLDFSSIPSGYTFAGADTSSNYPNCPAGGSMDVTWRFNAPTPPAGCSATVDTSPGIDACWTLSHAGGSSRDCRSATHSIPAGSWDARLDFGSIPAGCTYTGADTNNYPNCPAGGSGRVTWQFSCPAAPAPAPSPAPSPSPTQQCGNGVIDAGEECDGTNFGGKTCQSFGYSCGNLYCDPNPDDRGRTCQIRVVAGGGTCSNSCGSAPAPAPSQPSPPSGLAITDSAYLSYVSLQWTHANPTACDYGIYRRKDGGAFSRIAQTSNLVYTDRSSFSTGTYNYYVTCILPGSESGASNIVSWQNAAPPSPAPSLSISKGSYSFTATQGGSNPTDTLTITNTGSGYLTWYVSSNVPWLIVRRNFAGGEVSGTEGAGASSTPSLTVTANISGMPAGAGTATIFVDSNAGSRQIVVTLGISAQAPAQSCEASISSSGARACWTISYSGGSNYDCNSATRTIPAGSWDARLDFGSVQSGCTYTGADTNNYPNCPAGSSGRVTWQFSCAAPPSTQTCGNNMREGGEQCDGSDLAGQSCATRGYDGGTLSCSSCTYNDAGCWRDTTPPVVGASHIPSAPTTADIVTIFANATDSQSGVARLELYVDGVLRNVGGASVAPYSSAFSAGTHTYRAWASDARGNSANSANRSFYVTQSTAPAPTQPAPSQPNATAPRESPSYVGPAPTCIVEFGTSGLDDERAACFRLLRDGALYSTVCANSYSQMLPNGTWDIQLASLDSAYRFNFVTPARSQLCDGRYTTNVYWHWNFLNLNKKCSVTFDSNVGSVCYKFLLDGRARTANCSTYGYAATLGPQGLWDLQISPKEGFVYPPAITPPGSQLCSDSSNNITQIHWDVRFTRAAPSCDISVRANTDQACWKLLFNGREYQASCGNAQLTAVPAGEWDLQVSPITGLAYPPAIQPQGAQRCDGTNVEIVAWSIIFSPLNAPTSCQNRCGLYNSSAACQCDAACVTAGDCCRDYAQYCSAILPPPPNLNNPSLDILAPSYGFSSPEGGPPMSGALTISNKGGGYLSWNVSSSAPWLTVRRNLPGAETSGTEGPGASSSPPLTVTVNIAGLGRGNHTAVIIVDSNGGNALIPVKVAILPPGSARQISGTAEPASANSCTIILSSNVGGACFTVLSAGNINYTTRCGAAFNLSVPAGTWDMRLVSPPSGYALRNVTPLGPQTCDSATRLITWRWNFAPESAPAPSTPTPPGACRIIVRTNTDACNRLLRDGAFVAERCGSFESIGTAGEWDLQINPKEGYRFPPSISPLGAQRCDEERTKDIIWEVRFEPESQSPISGFFSFLASIFRR